MQLIRDSIISNMSISKALPVARKVSMKNSFNICCCSTTKFFVFKVSRSELYGEQLYCCYSAKGKSIKCQHPDESLASYADIILFFFGITYLHHIFSDVPLSSIYMEICAFSMHDPDSILSLSLAIAHEIFVFDIFLVTQIDCENVLSLAFDGVQTPCLMNVHIFPSTPFSLLRGTQSI